MFEIRNITKTFKNEVALREVSFSITGGMNYIIGASGSGKTTLLRILSAMDTEYEGEVFYHGRNLKEMTNQEKAQLYATEFGFIAQDFNLIEELTVRENILIPTYLKSGNQERKLNSLLKKLKIEQLADQRVSTLSGGQKQRVAIVRELMKDPQVLIADEPTAALDAKTAREIGKILSAISKERTVIVVTHDTSLIQGKCSVFELDKGVLCKCDVTEQMTRSKFLSEQKKHLPLHSAMQMAGVTYRRQAGKILSVVIAMIIAVTCLAVNFSGMLSGNSNEAFQQLLEQQGNAVLNLMIVPSFTGGTNWNQDTEDEIQSVDQDISGVLERVEAIIMDASMNDMVVTMDNKDFIVEFSGQAPVFNKMVAGKIADNSKNEIVLPEILVEKMGCTNEEIIGKEVSFIGTVFNWDSGEPVEIPVSFTARVSGVADTSYRIEYEGEFIEFEHEDSIFPSLTVMENIYAQAGKENPGFTIRPDTPEHYLEIYDELMSTGIVPLGQVELIRDIVGLKDTAVVQTGVSYTVLAVLSLLAVFSVCLLCGIMRKKEYAVYQLCGYTKTDLAIMTMAEYAGMFLVSAVVSMITVLALTGNIWLGFVLSFVICIGCFLETCLIFNWVTPLAVLKTGGRE